MRTNGLVQLFFGLCSLTFVSTCKKKDHDIVAVPAGFEDTVLAAGLSSPTAMTFAPDGRLFVCEKAGQLRVIKDGALLAEPFVSVAVVAQNERGLLGVALDPNFSSNGYVYIYHTDAATVRNHVTRYTASVGDPDVADPASAQLILDIGPANSGYHNGGALHFGPDGMLYIAAGEGHSTSNAPDLGNLLGKLLRIDATNFPDLVPADNPFASAPNSRGEIWANGLRNPFTFAIDAETGKIYVNDVGAQSWEEVNEIVKGANYGWPACEGLCSGSSFTNPVFAYNHDVGCAITGGTFYRGANFPAQFDGDYFFSDWCGKFIRRLRASDGGLDLFATGTDRVVDMTIGLDGTLCYLSLGMGQVRRIRYVTSENRTPVAAMVTTPSSGDAPLTVTFSAQGSSDPDAEPLAYDWNFGDGSPEESDFTVSHIYNVDGNYTVQLMVSDGRGGSATASTTLPVGNQPTGNILTPAAGITYQAGDVISFSGTAADAEDGALPDSAFSWTILFHHGQHTHPFLGPFSGISSGFFAIPQIGETSADVFYRIYLTVTDSSGIPHESTRDVLPVVVDLTLAADPPGLEITLDGQPQTAPVTIQGVAGMTRTLGATNPQSLNGKTYTFLTWSDGQPQTHAITTPATATTYTATFQGN